MRVKVVIVAPSKEIARQVAQDHELKIWQWRYAYSQQVLHGLGEGHTVLVHSDIHDPAGQWRLNLDIARDAGAEVAWVTT